MTVNVSFYVIAALALHEKSHSLYGRIMLIADHHVKKNCIYIYRYMFTWTGSKKGFKRNVKQKNLNLICSVSFKKNCTAC